MSAARKMVRWFMAHHETLVALAVTWFTAAVYLTSGR